MSDPRPATETDAPAIGRLLFASPQVGRMVLGQQRPDPFARRRPYEESLTLVVDADGDLAATGTAGRKSVLVDDATTEAAYVFDVATAADARGRGHARRVLSALESWATGRGAAFLYAHVLRGNAASVRTFERSGYRVSADLRARVYPAFGRRPPPPGQAHPITDWDAAAAMLGAGSRGYDLVRPLDGESLRRHWTGLTGWRPEDVWTTDRSILGLWDHSAVIQSVPLRLPPETRVLGALSGLAGRAGIPFPSVPRLGEPMRYGLLLGGVGDDAELSRLLPSVVGRAGERGLDVVVVFVDRRVSPPWTKAAFSVSDGYHLVAKVISPMARRLGARPVWPDPVDL